MTTPVRDRVTYPPPSPPQSPPPQPPPPAASEHVWFKRPGYKRLTPLQLVVLALATIPPILIAGSIVARALGFITTEAMVDFALGAGEDPGALAFIAMFLASPVQWFTGRSQVRVRKYLGIVFFLLALSNGAMFVIESGWSEAFSAPFLIAGTIALALAAPLFLTSSRWAQRSMGMKRWRRLHLLTYPVAVALFLHLILIPDGGPPAALLALGFIARIPAVRSRLIARQAGSTRQHLSASR